MPEISRFYGIKIYMHYGLREHPPAHFHAITSSSDAVFTLQGDLIEGELSTKEINMIRKWALLHQDELAHNWQMCWANENPFKIAPLK